MEEKSIVSLATFKWKELFVTSSYLMAGAVLLVFLFQSPFMLSREAERDLVRQVIKTQGGSANRTRYMAELAVIITSLMMGTWLIKRGPLGGFRPVNRRKDMVQK